jgi:ATP-dependent DNA ligase
MSTIKPMLAHKYRPDKVTFPCFVQPKLNGVRGIYVPGRHFQSRYGEIWHPSVTANMFMSLTGLQFYCDGEFYKHGMSLQQINSRVSVIRNAPHPEGDQVKFYIFDVIVDAPFHRRNLVLRELSKRFEIHPHIGVVKTMEVSSALEADYFYNQWKNVEGFEGMMYRDANAPYGFAARCGNKENRWNCLLKRKEMMDLDAIIVGLNQLVNKDGVLQPKLGSFQLKAPNGALFSAGSGLTDTQRVAYWNVGDDMLGMRVRVHFEMLSDNGTPLKPIIECVDYEA